MSLDQYFQIGQRLDLRTHTLTPDEIKAFAKKYDPQPFHLDEELARNSVFGRLCASGWHTASLWMRHNLLYTPRVKWTGKGEAPVFGPSPGFEKLRWPKPAFAGETIHFYQTVKAYRPLGSRAGWYMLTGQAEAVDSAEEKVLEFETRVLFQYG